MDPLTVAFLVIGSALLLIAIGAPVGVAMLVTSLIGMAILVGTREAVIFLGLAAYTLVGNFAMAAVPLFMLMGVLAGKARYSEEAYKVCGDFLGRFPGGLSLATVAGCAMFAASSGSSVATAAAVGKLAIPEMINYGYDERLATASVACAGTLGIMIPPSIPLVIYGIVTQSSIGKLLMAGAIPGLILAALFIVAITVSVKINPRLAPVIPARAISYKRRLLGTVKLWPLVVILITVMGGIYVGIWTPTEASAGGAAGVLVLALSMRRIGIREIWGGLSEVCEACAMVFLLVMASLFLGRLMVLSGFATWISTFLVESHMPSWVFLVAVTVLYVFLGCFLEGLSMMLLTVPILLPGVLAAGWSVIWFGVYVTLMMEVAAITPPVGLNVYVVSGISKIPSEVVFRGIIPFFLAAVGLVVILAFFPGIATFLPNMMLK